MVEFDDAADIVTVEDSDGFVREFYGAGSYENGDAVVLLTWDNGTPDAAFDDAVVDCLLPSSFLSLPA